MSESLSAITLPGVAGESTFRIPTRNLGEVLSPARVAATAPVNRLVEQALTEPVGCPPLAELVRPGAQVLVVVDDITRSTPVAAIVPTVLECLLAAGCAERDIRFALALGTHRPMTSAEIKRKLGSDIAQRFPVVNTPAQQRDAFVDTGESWEGVPIEVNRAVVESDFVLGIGSVVPHADAGWSGGCKIILPGLCSERTVMENHIRAAYYPGNLLGHEAPPIRLNMEGVVAKIGLDYILNVVMTPYGDVVAVIGGHFVAAQRAAVQKARAIYSVPFKERADIVIANAYPAEIDLWQASKGIWPGELMVRPGGTVILNAACPEGIGPHPEYLKLIQQDPEVTLADVAMGRLTDKTVVGGAVAIARMLKHMRLVIVSKGLRAACPDGAIAHYVDLQAAIDAYLPGIGPAGRVSVITHAGYTYPIQA
jgi:nickel-dependent lactate racemase